MKLRIGVGLAMAACLWGQAQGDAPGRVGRLSFSYGSVSYRPDAVEEWAPAAVNTPLTTGDHLWTDKESQAEVHVGLTAVHLAPETGFFIQKLDDRVFRIGIAEGALNLRIPRTNEGETVEVETPYGLFRLLSTGSYRVDVQPEGDYAAVIVRSGAAEAVVDGQAHPVPAGKRLVLTGKPPAVELMDAPPLDPWDKWCAERDEQTERGYDRSSQYISWEISGAADFADYGTWESDPDYGWCWFPRVLPSGWAPYRFGFWIWKNPWGWTWVDREPWGFATHHFGRWTRHPRRGTWVWRPDNDRFHPRFSPAHVEFARANGRISWAPVGHREAATTLTERDFVSARDANRSRLIVVERVPIEFTGRKLSIEPTREAMLGGRPSGGPTLRRDAQPVAARPIARRDEDDVRDRRRDSERPQPDPQTRNGAATVRERLPQTVTPPLPNGRGSEPAARRDEDEVRDREAARRLAEERRQREQEEARQALERRRRDAEESQRRDEDARRAEEARRQEEGRRAEQHRRQAEEARQRDEDNRRAEEARRQEEGRRAEEHRRQAEEARRQEEGRRAEEHRRQAEEARQRDEDNRRAEEARRQEEGRRAEEHRRQAEESRRQAEEQRRQEEGRRAEEQRRQAEESRRQEEEHRANQARKK